MRATLRARRGAVLLVAATCAIVAWTQTVAAQDAAPDVDPRPLERPRHICRVSTSDPAALVRRIGKTLGESGFVVDEIDGDEGLVKAHSDSEDRPSHVDKLIVWVERDLKQPLESCRVFFDFGHYQKLFGRTEPARVVTAEVPPVVQGAKRALVQLAVVAEDAK